MKKAFFCLLLALALVVLSEAHIRGWIQSAVGSAVQAAMEQREAKGAKNAAPSFYEQLGKLKKHLIPIAAGVLTGVVCSAGSIYLLAKLFVLPDTIMLSLLPKSVTSAIGIALSEEIGGIGALTMAAITITGISGNILAPTLCKWFHLEDPIAQGVAVGTSAHVIGTARAFEMSELAGAVGSLSLTVAGITTSVLLSMLAPYL